MNRRDFFSTLVFGALTFFVRRQTQAKLIMPHLEGKPIPRGLYISQVVGRGRPVYPQEKIQTAKLLSVVDFGSNQAQMSPQQMAALHLFN